MGGSPTMADPPPPQRRARYRRTFGLSDGTQDCTTTFTHFLNVLAGLALTVLSGGWLTFVNAMSLLCSDDPTLEAEPHCSTQQAFDISHVVLSAFTV
eukprot:SAG22_NODE_224_length_14744_cov_7.467668_2_plen_97_part_00